MSQFAFLRAEFPEVFALARKAGDDARMTVVEGAGHFEVIAPTTPAWPIVDKAVRSLAQ